MEEDTARTDATHNPYQAPLTAPLVKKRGNKRPFWKSLVITLLSLAPAIAMFQVMGRVGVGSDEITFSRDTAVVLTVPTIGAIALLVFAVRGWWRLWTVPVILLLVMGLFLVWTWNLRGGPLF